TKKKDDNSLAKGEEKTEKEGKKGKVSKTYEITKENGEEVSRELIDEEVLKESKDEVIAVGTKEESSSSNDDQKSAENESKKKVREIRIVRKVLVPNLQALAQTQTQAQENP